MSDPVDDKSIADDDILLRRITPEWVKNAHDPQLRSVSSAAAQNQPGHEAMSAHLASVLDEQGIPYKSMLEGFPGYGLIEFTSSLHKIWRLAV